MGTMMHETEIELLTAFIDHLKEKGVRSFKGEVPVGDGDGVDIEVVFERDGKQQPKPDEY
jgi:hypothetical protein